MDANTNITKVSKYVAISLVFLALAGLVFRSTVYWVIPVAPDEPAGLGEVIELLIYFAILGLAGFTVLLSLAMVLLKNYEYAIKVFMVSVITPVAYYFLHSFLPRLM